MKNRKISRLAEYGDDVIIINDNYITLGIKKGYIGLVVDNIDDKGYVLVDFLDTVNGGEIAVLVEVKYDDFIIFNKNLIEDQRASRDYDNMMKDRQQKRQ